MKTLHTIYTSFAKRLAIILTLFLTLGVTTAWAQEEELVYTLDGTTTGGTNAYDSGSEITQSEITWQVTGNTTMSPWRIGGKSIENKDRTVYSTKAIEDDISKIVITHGTASSITVNSMKVIVSTAQNGGGTVISILTPTFKVNGDVTIERPDGKDWSKAFYKIVYNVTVSASKNNYIEFTSAKFYKTNAPACEYTVQFNSNGGTGSMSDQIFTCDEPQKLTANSFSRTGYTFAGWNTKADGLGTSYTNQQSVTDLTSKGETITLYAQWTPTQYTITYIGLEGATHNNPTKYTIESETITFTAPSERVGYNFIGWNPASITKGSTGNKTITAQWTAKALTNYRTTCTEPCEQLGTATGLSVQTDYVDNGQTYVKFSWTPADNTKSHATKQVICIGKVGEEKKCTDLEENQNWSGDLLSDLTPGEYEWTIQAIGDGETYCDGEVISGPNFTIEEPLTDNCRWVEVTDNTTLEDGDKVVITMTKYGSNGLPSTYALPNAENTSSAPKATDVSTYIDGNELNYNENDADDFKWTVEKSKSYYIFHPANNGTLNLYCNIADDGVRVGSAPINAKSNHEFFILGNYLVNKITSRYVGVNITKGEWYSYQTNTGKIKDQTLKFYKKTCLPADEYWINYNLSNVTCTTDPIPSQIANDGEDLLLEFSANDGYKLPESISVSIGNNILPEDNDVYIWDSENGELSILAEQVTDNITITIEGCERLAAPTGLASSNLTSSSVTLSWNAVQNAESYTVYVTDGTNDITETTSECNVTISGLTKNTLYTWDVIATADGFCENEHSQEWIEFTTLDVFSVTFNNQGKGSAPAPQNVDAGGRATEPTVPTTTGYTFAGWYTDPACTNLFDFNTVITKNTPLYAKWTEWSYTITYAKGSPADEITGEHAPGTKMYTSALTLAGESFSRPGYKQTGWSKTDGGQKDYNLLGTYGTNEDVTLYPYWTKVHTITWMADGSTHDEATYLDGETLALPESAPEACQGSEFVGWSAEQNYSHATDAPAYITAGSIVNADEIYYAVYAEAIGESDQVIMQYTTKETTNMTGNNDASTLGLDEEWTVIATKGKSSNYPGLNKEGTIRLYYNVDGSNYITVTSSTSKTITDIEITYKKSYNQGVVIVNGNTIAGEELSSDESIQVLRYSVNATEFIIKNGYTTGNNNQVHITQVLIQTGSTTYANYSTTCSATYRVNYELAGGENGCADEGVKVGNDYTICGEEPTRTGYTFQHWTDGTNTYEAGATIENVQSNITLTAVWEANIYTITWMSNGEEYTTTTHTYDQTLEILSEPYTCYGTKTFMGWTETSHVNENGEGITYIEESTNPSEDQTYYAVFADEVVGEPEELEATLSFANKAQRTSFSSTQQVWEQNGIILTNNKASAQSNVGDYANPARFYAASSIDIQAPGNITKIVFACSESKYANALTTSIGTAATYSNTTVTATLDGKSKTFTIVSLSAQVQMSSLTITYQSTPETAYSNYTTTPSGCPEIEVAENAYVTSASGQSVKVNVPVKANNFANDMTITAAVEDGNFSVANVSAVTDGACTVTLAYKPTASNTTESATVTLTAKADDNEVTSTTFTVNGRSLPETFAVVAKVGGVWYALPSQGLNSTTPPAAYPVEVDDMADPRAVTAVPANADWSLRQVYASSSSNDRFADNGEKLVFVNDANPQKALNVGSTGNYLLTDAQYDGYHNTTNPGLYEWTPTTTDLETYTLTNVNRGVKMSINTSNVFGVHSQNVVTTQVRFLPIQNRYTPMAAQVVEWKDNSVVIMYNGNPTQTAQTSINGTNVGSVTLDNVQKDIAVYELPADGLGTKPNQTLSVTIGSEKLLLPTPYMVNSEVTDEVLLGSSLNVQARRDIAKVSNLVILKGGKLTSIGAKTNPYIFRNVTIYGGGTLVVSADKGFGANTLTMRVGGVEAGEYVYTYPQLDLNGTINSGNINLDLMTTNDYYYPFSVPYEVTLTDIHYPVEIYGSNVKPTNKGSFLVSYYDGEARSQGNTGWKDVEEQGKTVLSPHVGYSIWGLPKKVSVNGATSVRQTYGIHRIPMKKAAGDVMDNETKDQNVSISAYNATRDNDKGWNFIGNPYLVQHGGLDGSDTDVYMGLLVKEMKDGQWTGGWVFNGEQVRYVTQTNDCLNYTSTPVADATIPAFSAFFIQAKETGAIAFTSPNVAAAQSLTARRSDENKEITTGVILSGEKHSDRTGLLIADEFTEAYEFNADLSKFDNQDMNFYTISPSGKLAFMAINEELAKQIIPLGYSVSADGMYTIAFDEQRYNRDDIYALYLIDYDRNEITNLLHMDYDFYSETGAHAERFALQVAFAPNTSTDVEYTQVGGVLLSREGNTLRLDNLPSDATVTVYDAVGHLVEQHTASQLLQLTLQKGYYLLHIGNNQNSVVIDTFIP